jgi:hypothetical protein
VAAATRGFFFFSRFRRTDVIDGRRTRFVLITVILLAGAVRAQQQSQQPAGQQPAGQQPATPSPAPVAAPPLPGTVTCPAPTPPAKAPERMFNAPAGVIFHQVIATKVTDFEQFLSHVRDALAKTTDKTLQGQAKGWKFFRVSELGPNNDVLYAFVLDPAVPCADYALGPILAAAIPDEAKLMEVWNLYKGAVRGGGTLLNLVPVSESAKGATTLPATPKPAGQPPTTQPLDANPIKPPQ